MTTRAGIEKENKIDHKNMNYKLFGGHLSLIL